jgi:hypothetical protein
MFIWHIISAIVIGVLITIVFVYIFNRKGPWSNAGVFFLIIFLSMWAANLWIEPFGPSFLGIYWLPVVLTGLIFALLLAAAEIPSEDSRTQDETMIEAEIEEKVRSDSSRNRMSDLLLWTFFGILSCALVIAIVVGYVVTL